jgi:hypothetical protein
MQWRPSVQIQRMGKRSRSPAGEPSSGGELPKAMTDSQVQQGYLTAIAQASARLVEVSPTEVAARSGSTYHPDTQEFTLRFLGQDYRIPWPAGAVTNVVAAEVARATQVLLLTYLLEARAQALTGELIAFRDVPGAATYTPNFDKRAIAPLGKHFAGHPGLLTHTARRLDGTPATVGDESVILPVLPRLPVTYAVWHPDDEFPARAAILFDASARRMLSAEGLVVAASAGTYELLRLARAG